MKFYKVTDHEPSILPDGDWEMTWSDEFDGTGGDYDDGWFDGGSGEEADDGNW